MLESSTSVVDLSIQGPDNIKVISRMIARVLQANTTLQRLILHTIVFTDEAVSLVAANLRANTSLQKLGLMYCSVSPVGVRYLAEALEGNATLTSLNLIGNKIGVDGAKQFLECLKMNRSLRFFRVLPNSGIKGNEPVLGQIEDLLRKNEGPPLKLSLHFDKNAAKGVHFKESSGAPARDANNEEFTLGTDPEMTVTEFYWEVEVRMGLPDGRVHVELPDGRLLHSLDGRAPIDSFGPHKRNVQPNREPRQARPAPLPVNPNPCTVS